MMRFGSRLCNYLVAPGSRCSVTFINLSSLQTAPIISSRNYCGPVKGNPSKENQNVDEEIIELHEEKKQNSVKITRDNSGIFELTEAPKESKITQPKVMQSKFVVMFENSLSKGKSRELFVDVLETFEKNDRTRRGHMELLTTAMNYMDKYGLEKDLIAYNAMLTVFPRGRFQNKTLFDAIWPKKQPQVDVALEILTKMEENVVKPSLETYDICEEIFGKASQPVQKVRRLAYWLTKLEEMFPNPLPAELPEGELELSMIALERMTKDAIPISVYQDAVGETSKQFIVCSQSDEQQKLIEQYDTSRPVYVEGPYFLWIRRLRRHFYTLRGHTVDSLADDEEGAILAVCMASPDCNQDALRKWILDLQEKTPNLANINVIFNLQEAETATSLEEV